MASSPFSRRDAAAPSLPKGDVLGTYDTYPEAQAVVDRLSKRDFPVKSLAIIGNDVKSVERVTGKLSYARAAGTGAATGAWFGLFIGLIVFLFSQNDGAFMFVGAAMFIGAGFMMIFNMVTYAVTRSRRDFTSTHQAIAANYQIIVDPQLTLRAQEILSSPDPER